MTIDHARAVADAVLFEGYALYPYRRSAIKNQQRWPFGVLAPRAFEAAGGGEASWMRTECLVVPDGAARIEGKLRFLRMCRRRVFDMRTGDARDVDALEVDGARLVSWDEADVQEIDFTLAPVRGDGPSRVDAPFDLPGSYDTELVRDCAGDVAARVVRERAPLAGSVRVEAEPIRAREPCVRVRVTVENVTPWTGRADKRHLALASFFIGTPALLAVENGAVLSLMDPPAWAERAAAACSNVRAYPVLACAEDRRDVVLASPIILYDHPRVAPESSFDFFDATEIDELLALRTRTLTDDEKREARALDPRVARLVDRADALPEAVMDRLHGAVRELGWAREPAVDLAPGARVLLHPGPRRCDAQDMFLDGKTATVRAVLRDVDDRAYVAVTIDDDPAADLHLLKNRFLYFYRDEIEPVTSASS